MEFVASGWQVTVAGQVVRLDDLPLAAWERITETSGEPWIECYYKPLADLSVAKLVYAEAAASVGANPADVLDNVTIPALLALFETASDDLPVEVTDGNPQQGDGSLTAG